MSSKQAVIFDKSKGWNEKLAHKWLKEHHLQPIERVRKTKNFLRYRLEQPKKNERFRLMDFGHGIKSVIALRH